MEYKANYVNEVGEITEFPEIILLSSFRKIAKIGLKLAEEAEVKVGGLKGKWGEIKKSFPLAKIPEADLPKMSISVWVEKEVWQPVDWELKKNKIIDITGEGLMMGIGHLNSVAEGHEDVQKKIIEQAMEIQQLKDKIRRRNCQIEKLRERFNFLLEDLCKSE